MPFALYLCGSFISISLILRLYRERITQIENKLQEVMAEQAAEYLGPLAELREAVAVRTQVAGILRQLRLENIRNKALAEEVAANQDFEVFLTSNSHKCGNCSQFIIFSCSVKESTPYGFNQRISE